MEHSDSEPTPPTQEILSPTDVDRLLAEVADQDPAIPQPTPETVKDFEAGYRAQIDPRLG